jgi:hypothetical protein
LASFLKLNKDLSGTLKDLDKALFGINFQLVKKKLLRQYLASFLKLNKDLSGTLKDLDKALFGINFQLLKKITP